MHLLLNLDVPDLDAAEAFYTRAFGLTASRRLGPQVSEMGGATVPFYLLRKEAGTQGAAGSLRDYSRHWSPLHVDVVVEDLDAALVQALDAGARQEGGIRDAEWGRIVTVSDPFGHGWCLLQFLGRGYNEITS